MPEQCEITTQVRGAEKPLAVKDRAFGAYSRDTLRYYNVCMHT